MYFLVAFECNPDAEIYRWTDFLSVHVLQQCDLYEDKLIVKGVLW